VDPLGHGSDPGLYAAFNGNPAAYWDADGRYGKQGANFIYNGGVAGYGLRGLAGIYGDLGAASDNSYLSWNAYNGSSLLGLAADFVTPASYVSGYNTGVERSANVMAGELANGSGWTWTAGQGLSSIVGDAVGYNNALESGLGVDRQSGQLLGGVDRASRGFMALSQMAGTTASLGAMYNPSATFLGQPVPPVIAAQNTTALDWSIVSKSGETRSTHVTAQHGALNLQKPVQGVFYGNPVSALDDAWAIAQQQGINPITSGGVDIYVVPRPNSGFAGGYLGQGQNLNTVTILTQPGTPRIITGYPGNGTPLPHP
jgi:filamentous hemagglutinin